MNYIVYYKLQIINTYYKRVLSPSIWYFTLFMDEDELCYLLQITSNKYLLQKGCVFFYLAFYIICGWEWIMLFITNYK